MTDSLSYSFSDTPTSDLAYKVACTITSCLYAYQLQTAKNFSVLAVKKLKKEEKFDDAEELTRLITFLATSKNRELINVSTLIRGNHVLN